MNSNAYWLSPKGKSTEVSITHIDSIIKNPKYFGLTKDAIKKVYDEYNEKIGVEGEARSKVMTSLMRKGWIRIRHLPRQDMWTMQTYFFGNREKNNTWDWIRYSVEKKIANRYADLRILIIKSGRIISSSFAEAFKGKKIFEALFKKKKDMKLTTILNESSLSRVYKHNEKHDCGAMTAFRTARACSTGEPFSNNENKKRNKSLLAKLLSIGYGITKLSGRYPEAGKMSKELSFFIVDINDTGKLLNDLKKLGNMFEQDSILFIPKGTVNGDNKAFLIGTNKCDNNFLSFGQKELFHGGGKFGKTSKIYTSYVNGRPFIFEKVEEERVLTPGNGMGVWSLHLIAKKDWTEL